MQTRTKALFPLVLIIAACVTDEVPLDEAPQDSTAEITTEESMIPESSVDDEEIEIIYREATDSLEVVVNVESFAPTRPGSTVAVQIDVTTAQGVTTRHDLNWTHGEKQRIPRIEAPVLYDGRYEVVVAGLTIDGRVIDRPLTRQRMDVRGDHDLYTHPDDDDGGWEDDDDDDDDGGGHDDDDDDGGHDGGGWDDDDDGGWDDDGGHDGDGGGEKCKKGKEKHGSDYADKLRGTERNDELYGRDGKDKLWGYECHDRLYGGKGRDTLKGGKGNDFLHGGKGEDICIGGKGKDEFRSCEYIER